MDLADTLAHFEVFYRKLGTCVKRVIVEILNIISGWNKNETNVPM